VIDHTYSPFLNVSREMMKELAPMGILFNFTWDELSPLLGVDPQIMYNTIREVGVEHFTLSSDAGEPLFPDSVEAMRLVRGYMEAFGLNQEELFTVCTKNPAKWSGWISISAVCYRGECLAHSSFEPITGSQEQALSFIEKSFLAAGNRAPNQSRPELSHPRRAVVFTDAQLWRLNSWDPGMPQIAHARGKSAKLSIGLGWHPSCSYRQPWETQPRRYSSWTATKVSANRLELSSRA
jgi:hypothetical protein